MNAVAAATTPEAVATRRTPRALLMLPAGLALLAGLDAALILLDVPAPVRTERLPEIHGMLLVLGFVGTVVALERAVALRRWYGYLAPAALGVGGVLLLSPAPLTAGRIALLIGTISMTLNYVPLWRRQHDEAVAVQALGAVTATGAAALWLGGVDVATLLPWLAGFPVLTIAGERLELARIAMGPRAGAVLAGLGSATLAAIAASLLWPGVGTPLLGAALLALTCWLAGHDVARRTIGSTGAVRFSAAAMLAGYVWLGLAGAVWLLGVPDHRPAYDTVIHAVFLGFTMSMILAHAPTILPAVLRRPLPYHPAMWVPLLLLHAGLVVRVWLGDGLGVDAAWRIGGVLNVVALLLFAGTVLTLLTRKALR